MTKLSLLAQSALCTSLTFAVGAGSAQAADVTRTGGAFPPSVTLPAVSGLNGKLDIGLGQITPANSSGLGTGWRVQGAVSIPFQYSYGLQLDGVVASIQSLTFTQFAAHAFWRNPAQGLVGAYAGYSAWNGLTRDRFAIEGEAYLGRLSLETLTGYEIGSLQNSFFTISDAAFYPNDNFRISAGFRYNASTAALAGGAEYQFVSGPTVAWAGFVDGTLGANGYQSLFGGVRLYFGADKSLIRRHREDDPRIKTDEESLVDCSTGGLLVDGLTTLDSLTSSCGTPLK